MRVERNQKEKNWESEGSKKNLPKNWNRRMLSMRAIETREEAAISHTLLLTNSNEGGWYGRPTRKTHNPQSIQAMVLSRWERHLLNRWEWRILRFKANHWWHRRALHMRMYLGISLKKGLISNIFSNQDMLSLPTVMRPKVLYKPTLFSCFHTLAIIYTPGC